MTKKQNTFIFILVGTLVSVLMTLILIVLFWFLVALIFRNNESAMSVGISLSIIAALFLSMFIYQKLVIWAVGKFRLEDKLDPIFTKKTKKPKDY